MAIPWGDLVTAFESTRIPDITVYMAAPPGMVATARAARLFAPLFRSSALQAFAKSQIERFVAGPTEQQRASAKVELWGRASGAAGNAVEMTMTLPEGYSFTAEAALAAVLRLLNDASVEAGARTPSQAFGADFVKSLPGVTVRE